MKLYNHKRLPIIGGMIVDEAEKRSDETCSVGKPILNERNMKYIKDLRKLLGLG